MPPPLPRLPRDLIEHIAATIRRVDGNHTMGAAALTEAIVANLPTDATLTALHAEFAEAHADGASSNDVVQLLDDFLTA
jgi:hypothetical protein